MKYIIPFVIAGSIAIEADSAEEAEAKLDRWGIHDFADQGELEVLAPRPIEVGARPKVWSGLNE